MTDLVIRECRDGVTTLRLNRPDRLNAIDYALADELLRHLDELETDDAVRAVILTGSGERAFSAGGDIHEFAASVQRGVNAAIRDFVRRGQTLTRRLENYPKPVIVAVNGLAFGGGCELTEAAHLAVASEDAMFAKPEVRLGMPPAFGGTQRLPRLAGRKRALELLLTGEPFTAHRALELGLVNAVVTPAELPSAAHGLARRITRHSPLAVTSILTAVTRGINGSIDEGLLIESEQFARMVPTQDLAEGLHAWIDGREPAFTGQ